MPKGTTLIHVVTYDLHKPERDYAAVEKIIQTASGGYVRADESVWLVDTLKDPSEWRDWLKAAAADATYFIAQLQQNWASSALPKEATTWLKDAARRW